MATRKSNKTKTRKLRRTTRTFSGLKSAKRAENLMVKYRRGGSYRVYRRGLRVLCEGYKASEIDSCRMSMLAIIDR